jgi:hypothetical protein
LADLKQRVEALERRFGVIFDGMEQVFEDSEAMAIHLRQLRALGKSLRGYRAINVNALQLPE